MNLSILKEMYTEYQKIKALHTVEAGRDSEGRLQRIDATEFPTGTPEWALTLHDAYAQYQASRASK